MADHSTISRLSVKARKARHEMLAIAWLTALREETDIAAED